jgi:murein DD-endopeptidase MepM/ murein hydrolase activator NlpD
MVGGSLPGSVALARSRRPQLPPSERLAALQASLVPLEVRIRTGTAMWMAMQATVKPTLANLWHERHLLRRHPHGAAAEQLRAAIRGDLRILRPLLPGWNRVKVQLRRDWKRVKATIGRLRRVVVDVLGPIPGSKGSAGWRRVFRPGPAAGALAACPVDGPSAWADTFGAPRPGGRIHEGDDLHSAIGTPVVAAIDGSVRRVPNPLGGNALIVDGAGGTYLYYAHLSAYGAAGAVMAGTVVGYVGDTGSARGLIPHLHFEFHPGGGAAVDPTPLLQAAC